jgi:hypothetical protein
MELWKVEGDGSDDGIAWLSDFRPPIIRALKNV